MGKIAMKTDFDSEDYSRGIGKYTFENFFTDLPV